MNSPIEFPEWITYTEASTLPRWSLVDYQHIDTENELNNGTTNVYCRVLDKDGNYLAGVRIYQDWGDDAASELTKPKGELDFAGVPYGCTFFKSPESSFDPARNEVGPYAFYVDGGVGDKISGSGLRLKRHEQELLTWQWIEDVPELPPPPPPPPPPPTGEQWRVKVSRPKRIVLVLE